MRGKPGDHVVIHATFLDSPQRKGEIIEVMGESDREHYRIRWSDGHESVYFPGPDAHIEPSTETEKP